MNKVGYILAIVLIGSPVWAESKPVEPEPAAREPAAAGGQPATLDIAVEVPPPGPPPATEASAGKKTVWLDDALPEAAQTEGTWIWDLETKTSGTQSHGHPSGKGSQSHAFTAAPQKLSLQGQILQEVWLDPKDPPSGIAVRFRLAGGDEAGVYWEGEQEVFTPGEYEELWYYGLLPELGKWTQLEILAEDLGLEGEEITGVRFMTYGGRALWDRTILTELPLEEEAAAPGQS